MNVQLNCSLKPLRTIAGKTASDLLVQVVNANLKQIQTKPKQTKVASESVRDNEVRVKERGIYVLDMVLVDFRQLHCFDIAFSNWGCTI